ncbi:LysM peptidoglycan-binding domain-containing protein [Carboxylicivirga linearis]|uniref:LysM peptidoglycan-binding domain-containing protein n=1 Tax=Carboxylicivirga linearis TaxID=1628157 RepID=A0ABS5JWB0_9BACT|nr:LysM domain-containing protein [Carboxylicivirga linearis]MBS2099197.1 LysM peptidoglycan-binding domain-containing protein [Carboxylicivirga linearis]
MASYKVSEQQSLFDVAVQKLGSPEAAFVLAMENGLSLTDELSPGYSLELPEEWNSKVVDYFRKANMVPATFAENASLQNENIEVIYWSNELKRQTGVHVSEKQSLFDVAIQKGGSFESVMELASLNGLSITDSLTPGQQLELPTVIDNDIVSYYSSKGIVPETASSETEDSIPVLEGIDYWAIEVDFIVS